MIFFDRFDFRVVVRSTKTLAFLLAAVAVIAPGCTSSEPAPNEPLKVVKNPATDEERERTDEEVRLVAEIRETGGAVSQIDGNALVTLTSGANGEALTEETFEKVIYLNEHQKVTVIYVESDELNDRSMAAFAKLPDLQRIQISSVNITDAGFAHLAGLENLESLDINSPKITDAALEHLAGLDNLTILRLIQTKITGSGLSHLVGLSKLNSIALEDAPVTDAGLEYLSQMSALEDLDLRGSKVTDAGIALLRSHPNLTTIILLGTQVTPAGAKSLRDANSRFRVYQ